MNMKNKMKRQLRIAFVISAVITVVAGIAFPVLAQVREPDSQSIEQVEVYRNALVPGDQLYLITYEREYTTNPQWGIDRTCIFRLMNGATELAAVTAEPFHDDGYDLGLASIYFDAASAPAWSGAYTVEMVGNPTLHWMADEATTAMDGAMADDGGVFTNETAASNDAVANDMTLMPVLPVANDAYYFGSNGMFDILTINVGTNGNWTGTYTWEYYDGTDWEAVSGLNDGTTGFSTGVGIQHVTYDCPEDWQPVTVNAVTAYWLRFRIVTFSAIIAQPLGTQSWTNTLANPPQVSTSVFSLWYDGGSVATTTSRLTTRLRTLAQNLEEDWAMPPTTDLIELVAGVPKLTMMGEEYFAATIPGLRSMAPDLFRDVIITPEFPEMLAGGSSATGGDDTDHDVYDVNWYGQTFTPIRTEPLNGVYLKMMRMGTPGDMTVALRATLGGLPVGADLTTGTIDIGIFTTTATGGWYHITFNEDYEVTNGTTYAIIVRVLPGLATSYAGWRVDTTTESALAHSWFVLGILPTGSEWIISRAGTTTSFFYVGPDASGTGGYAGGQAVSSVNSGVAWLPISAGGQDFMFQTTLREGFSMSLRNRLANRLVDTKFDMTDLGAGFGLSRMWMSAIVWLIFGVTLPTIYMVRAANSFKPATLTVMFLLPVGAYLGFLYLEVAIMSSFLSGVAAIYVFFFGKAT